VTGDVYRRIERRVALATLLAAVLVGLTGSGVVVARSASPSTPVDVAGPPPREASPPPVPAAPAGDPLRVRIPAIGVVASLVGLGLNPDRTLEVPDYKEAGWYTGASRPGDLGPSVIAAHVDSTTGPSVFHRLRELKPGDVVHVDYRGGASVTFAVSRSESFRKASFPTAQVYGATAGPELRLITCDGTFDRRVRSYRSNLVVWASPPSLG
jgi:hypothetical protein